ncbi:MAG: HAMP domain-containing protein [Deltaproteobacteria bacterium]|nr:HAMP domain-containing protein [Deltaproteobacteria bacterium]
MSLKRLPSLRHSLALRLTLWYAGIFLLSAGIAFAFFYYLITSTIRGRTDQDLLGEVRSFSSVMLRQGIEAVKRQAVLESQAAGEKKIFIQLVYPDGRVFSSSNMSYFLNIPVAKEAISRMLEQGEPLFATVSSPDRSHEIRVVYALLGPGLIVHLGQAMDDLTRIIDAFQRTFVAIMAVLFILAAVIGWFMARRALAGVENVTHTARRISGSSLTERVPVTGREDEIDQLAVTFNRMLDRIQTLVSGIKEMTDNIAHDLKSPITRIRGQAELALLGSGSPEDYETMAASAIEECDRLIEMINTMLFISRTEAGVIRPELAEMDIAALVRDACRLFQAPAEEKGIALDGRGPERLALAGDIRLVQRMVGNLLDNAIKYTHAGGRVDVAVRSPAGGRVEIEVRDTGPGISATDLPHVFERFYRGDPSRAQTGAGLGLSFARAVARAHGGDITAVSSPGGGSIFTVTLPVRPVQPEMASR